MCKKRKKISEGLGRMKLMFFLLVILLGCGNLVSGTIDYGYVVVRCTGTISVDVLDSWATAWFEVEDSTQAPTGTSQTRVSINSITVKNDSVGVLCKWAVWVSSIQRTTDGENWVSDVGDGAWSLAQTAGICTAVLRAVFATQRPGESDFGTGTDDLLSVNYNPSSSDLGNYTYKTGSSHLGPANFAYSSDYSLGTTQIIAPNGTRGLYFRIDTPTAILDEYPRRFVISVRTQYGSQGW